MQNWFLKPKSNSKTAGLVQAISRRNQELSNSVCVCNKFNKESRLQNQSQFFA